MRVYLSGQYVPMNNVTWDMLGSPRVHVDYGEDLDVKWPARIEFEKRMAINEVRNLLGIKTGNIPDSFLKKMGRFFGIII